MSAHTTDYIVGTVLIGGAFVGCLISLVVFTARERRTGQALLVANMRARDAADRIYRHGVTAELRDIERAIGITDNDATWDAEIDAAIALAMKPIHDATAAHIAAMEAAELDDDAAVARWLA